MPPSVGQRDGAAGPMTLVRDLQSKTETLFLQSKTLQQEVKRLEALHPVICVLPPEPSKIIRIIRRLIPALRQRHELSLLRGSGLFDSAWYLARNGDVARARIDPAEHYLRIGGQEGRNPGPYFHSGHYLRMYPDIAAQELNPLLHYLKSGWREGRAIRPGMGHGERIGHTASLNAAGSE